MIYLVLGNHKSGTTLVSELLHHSGIAMIDEVGEIVGYDRGGFYERLDWVYLNQELIGFGDPAEDHSAPPSIFVTEGQRSRMREGVARCDQSYADWGFKDPRMLLCYHLWREEFSDHRLVAIYRGLPAVWGHYNKKRQSSASTYKVVRQWCEYNERLLQILESTEQDCLLLRYEELMSGDEELARLQRFLGRPMEDRRKPGMRRAEPRARLRISLVAKLRSMLGGSYANTIQASLDRRWIDQRKQEGLETE